MAAAVQGLQKPACVCAGLLHEVAPGAQPRQATVHRRARICAAAASVRGLQSDCPSGCSPRALPMALPVDPSRDTVWLRSASPVIPLGPPHAIAKLPVTLHAPAPRARNARLQIEPEQRRTAENSSGAAACVRAIRLELAKHDWVLVRPPVLPAEEAQ